MAAGAGRALSVPRLVRFEPGSLDSARRAFAKAPSAALGQGWREAPEPGFRPGAVRVGYREQCLHVLAELEDESVATAAVRAGQRLWELGDVFEIFLETAGAREYHELHVAPGNLRARLRIPLPRPDAPPERLMTEPGFHSTVWTGGGGWQVLASIPFALLGGEPARYSFSRYDHSPGRAPVLSSSSPHAAADFHRREEWGELRFS